MVVTTSLQPGYLRATAQGRFILAHANRAFFNMLDIAEDERARRILLDGRAITGAPRSLERYLYGKLAAEAEIQLFEGLKSRHRKKLDDVIENLGTQAVRRPTIL